jgi:uncharacterized protein (DUF1778 family)
MKQRRGPKPRPDEKIRGKSIQIMVLPEEREQIERLAEAAGESVSSFCLPAIQRLLAKHKDQIKSK